MPRYCRWRCKKDFAPLHSEGVICSQAKKALCPLFTARARLHFRVYYANSTLYRAKSLKMNYNDIVNLSTHAINVVTASGIMPFFMILTLAEILKKRWALRVSPLRVTTKYEIRDKCHWASCWHTGLLAYITRITNQPTEQAVRACVRDVFRRGACLYFSQRSPADLFCTQAYEKVTFAWNYMSQLGKWRAKSQAARSKLLLFMLRCECTMAMGH